MKKTEIIEKWYTLSQGGEVEEDDIYFRFMALWVAFNALYNLRHGYVGGDQQRVLALAGEMEAQDLHVHLLRANQDYRGAVQLIKSEGVVNEGSKRRHHIRDESELTDVMYCVYQVRNNLFHGDKGGDGRDEDLVRASHTIVSKLMTAYL